MIDGGVNDETIKLLAKPDIVVCGSYLAKGGDIHKLHATDNIFPTRN